MDKDVLIVGAKPAGLVLALWLVKQGISVRIIDKDSSPCETAGAMAIQARTLELYRQLDLADELIEAGEKIPGIDFWLDGQCKSHMSFEELSANLTPYPFILNYHQNAHETLLIKRLEELGVFVERETELVGFENNEYYVSARLRLPNQNETICQTYYLAGCDGPHSFVSYPRIKRVFVLGDVACTNGGFQGMNTGLVDGINLAWKLAAVLQGSAPAKLLDSYLIERRSFTRKLVSSTDSMFSFVAADKNEAPRVRRQIAQRVAGLLFKIKPIRELLFRIISQTILNYHKSPLSSGVAGRIRGGDRLPWVVTPLADNYTSLRAIGWQVHVYGEEPPEIRGWCAHKGLVFHAFTWAPNYAKAGFIEGGVYVLRPDTYVALADAHPTPATLEYYFKTIGWVNKA